jgi:outer membrane protein TolC
VGNRGILHRYIKQGLSTLAFALWLPCQAQILTLPAPKATHTVGTTMTIHEAVLLTLRNNPDIISAELDRITQKYGLILARDQYMPHFTLGGALTANSGAHATAGINPIQATIDHSALGVTGALAYDPTSGTMNLDVKKELWAGNSYVANMDPLWTAQEQAIIDKLTYQDNIVDIIHKTTQAYRQLALSKLTLANERFSLHSYLEQLKDAKLKLKLGRGTQFDVNQSKLNIATSKSAIVTDQQQIQSDRVSLNETLGLDPNVTIHISNDIPLPHIHIGSLPKAEKAALERSTAYYQAKIALKQAKRKLTIDKNAAKPSLSYEGTSSFGGVTSGPNITNTLTWGIPINNVQNKYSIIADRVAIIKNKQALNTAKNQVISQMTLDYNALKNALVSWDLANQTLTLNEETVKQQTAQYQAGKLNLYDLSTAKQALTQTRNNLLTSKNSLWEDLESFRKDTGTVLSSWGISLNPINIQRRL